MAILFFPGEAELTRFLGSKPARAESVLFYRREHKGETLESEFDQKAGTIRFTLHSTVEQGTNAEIHLKKGQR